MKITHVRLRRRSTPKGSALSIDLRTHGVTDRSGGTAAQGIFLTATTGAGPRAPCSSCATTPVWTTSW